MKVFFINLVYTLLWLIAIFVFIYLSRLIYISEDNIIYISSLAILLSAFLASTSVIKSIDNSNLLHSKAVIAKKNTNIIQIDFILIDIYRQVKHIQEELFQISKRNKNLQEKKEFCPHIKNQSVDYIIKIIGDRKNQLLKRLNQLEDKDILYSLDEGQRIIVLKISNDISTLEYFFNHIENSKNTNILDSFLNENKPLFSKLEKMIEILKQDIEKQNNDLRILSLEEYKNDYNT